MRILVTGGAGYIGCQVVLKLLNAGHEVTSFDNLSTGQLQWLPGGAFVEGDTRDIKALEKALASSNAEAVVHLAAASNLRESVGDPVKYYSNNVTGTLNLAQACITGGVGYIVFSSSASVYGMPSAKNVTENSSLNPISPYGKSKLIGEQILTDCANAGHFEFIGLRFFNVAGADPGGHCGESSADAWHLIKIACQAVTGQRPSLTIFGINHATEDGTCIRDYVHVDDVAGAHLAALDYLLSGGQSEMLNVGYGHGASVRQVITLASSLADHKFPVYNGPARDGDPPRLVADPERIRQVLGWAPAHDNLEKIIRSALDWEIKLVADADIFWKA